MGAVSFIIPVYNAELYLKGCIVSLMEAVRKEDEIVLIDDGSCDGSSELCEELAQTYPQIRVLHQKNSGVSAARNRGIEIAQKEYLVFLDADDSVETERLVQLLDELRSGEPCDLVMFGLSFDYYYNGQCYRRELLLDPEERVMEPRQWGEQLHPLFSKNLISPIWNKAFRKAVIDEHHLRLREDLFLYEDLEFVLRFMCCCGTIRNCPDVIYRYRQSEDEGNAKRRLKRIASLTDLVQIFADDFTCMIEQKRFGDKTHLDVQQILLELYLTLFREKAAVTNWRDMPALSSAFAAWARDIPKEVIDRLPAKSRRYLDDAVSGRRTKLALQERMVALRHKIAVRVKNTELYQKHYRKD